MTEVYEFRTRHEPSIPMFDRAGAEFRVTLDVKELRSGSDEDGWTPWDPYSTRMRCGSDVVVAADDGTYHLLHDGRVICPPDPMH